MRVEWQIILFILILNVSTLVILDLGSLGVIPGIAYSSPANSTASNAQYNTVFNATAIMNTWTPPTTWGLIGDLLGGLGFFFTQLVFVITGFPLFLNQLGNTYITDTTGFLVWNVITGALITVFGIYMSAFIIQLITGRQINE